MLKRTRNIFLIILAVFIVFYALVWLLSPPVTRLVLNKVLANENVQLTEESHVRLNLFLSRLTIENFALQRSAERTLFVQQMQVRYSLLPLLGQEVHIKKVTLDGFSMVLDIDGDDAHAAGFLLNRPATPEVEQGKASTEPQVGRKVAVAVPEISLKNLSLEIINGSERHLLAFEAIDIERTLYQQAVLESNARLSGAFDGAPFSIQTRLDYGVDSATAQLQLQLSELALEKYQYLLPSAIEALSGKAGLELKLELQRDGAALSASKLASTVRLEQLGYRDQQYQAQMDMFELQVSEGALSYGAGATPAFEGMFGLQSSGIEAALAGSGEGLAGIHGLQLDTGRVVFKAGAPDITVEKVRLNQLWFSRPEEQALPLISQLEQVEIASIAASEQQLVIDRLAIAGGNIALVRDEEGAIINLVATSPAPLEPVKNSNTEPQASETASAENESPGEESTGEAPFVIALKTFEISEALKISVKDSSVKPHFYETFYLEKASITDISNASPENLSKYQLALNDGEFFKFDLSGSITPFAEKLSGDFSLVTREFSLPEVSPYVSDALGFNISAGQMDLDFKGTIEQDLLKSLADSHLRGAEFKSDKNYDENDMLGQTAIPLNVALGMLKDGDGNIHLKIPVNGDLRSPDFSLNHVIGLVVRKAAMSQAKSYLIKTFVPYGQVLSVAMAAGSYALKVRFQDLAYTDTQLEPGEPQLVFAEQLATLMQDKPDLQIKVCPIITPADLAETSGKTALNDAEKILLLKFGEQRASAFKRFMVNNKAIDSSRLLLCTPEIEIKEKNNPRIKFSI